MRAIQRTTGLMLSLMGLSLLAAGADVQDPAATDALAPLLDGIAARVAAYVPLESWRATVESVQTKVDKRGTPEKVTTIRRVVTVRNDDYDEEVLKAEETEKGRTRDVTAEYVKDSRERIDKRRREAAERQAEGKASSGEDDKSLELSLTEFLPFDAARRGAFDFVRLPDADVDGVPALVLAVKARVPDEKNWEGTYFVGPERFDILKAVLRPSKNPRFVKELEMEMTLTVLPGGHLVLRSSRARINAGMFLKRVRMVSEDAYSGYEVLPDAAR